MESSDYIKIVSFKARALIFYNHINNTYINQSWNIEKDWFTQSRTKNRQSRAVENNRMDVNGLQRPSSTISAWSVVSRVYLTVLKGQCHEINIFLKVLNIKNSTFWISDGFHIFWLSFFRNSKIKFLCMLLWNHLLIVKILPVTLFRGLVPTFRNLPVTLRV